MEGRGKLATRPSDSNKVVASHENDGETPHTSNATSSTTTVEEIAKQNSDDGLPEQVWKTVPDHNSSIFETETKNIETNYTAFQKDPRESFDILQCVEIQTSIDDCAARHVSLQPHNEESAKLQGPETESTNAKNDLQQHEQAPLDQGPATIEDFQIGDHVYQWRSFMGIPRVFHHHGIVINVQYEPDNTMDDTNNVETKPPKVKLTIADFSNVEANKRTKSERKSVKEKNRRVLTQEGILRAYTDTDKWYKVEYKASLWKRSVFRAGTCTGASSDPVGLVLARVNFILQHPSELPDYHVVNANCECVAVWCKTGRWSTLQASSFLEMTAAGQVKSSATLATAAASAQVTVQAPAAGLWGWLGYTTTTQMSWLSLHPAVIPALAGYAAFTIGVPAIMYLQARKHWQETTKRLQESFWNDAMENPEVFAECLTHWSTKNS